MTETDDNVWYDPGLKFECTRCGNCCTGAPGFVWVDDDEVKALAAMRGEPLREFIAMRTTMARGRRTLREKPNGDCIFFEHGVGCVVYAKRPKQCRTWPFWDSILESEETWNRKAENCPGMNQGELIPTLEIRKRANLIPM